MLFIGPRELNQKWEALSFDEQTECKILVSKQRYEMPLGGAKGKVARIAFVVFSLVLLMIVGCYSAGFVPPIWMILDFICRISITLLDAVCRLIIALLVIMVVALVYPSLFVTWRMIWGSRFPLAAVLSLAVSALLVAAVAWGVANFDMLFGAVAGVWWDGNRLHEAIAMCFALILASILSGITLDPLNDYLERLEIVQCHEKKGE